MKLFSAVYISGFKAIHLLCDARCDDFKTCPITSNIVNQFICLFVCLFVCFPLHSINPNKTKVQSWHLWHICDYNQGSPHMLVTRCLEADFSRF
jgi:hypothetical protein